MSWPVKFDVMQEESMQEEPMHVEADQLYEEADSMKKQTNGTYIVHNATLDVESYASGYTSLGRLHRLIYVADHCPALRIEALTIALSDVLKTYNVILYQQIYPKLKKALEASDMEETCSPLDERWIETTQKSAAIKLERLDTDLKNYKSNSITESIRRSHEELGIHYLDCGDITNALRSFTRTKDSCSGVKQSINTFINIIKMNVYLQNWSNAYIFANKILELPALNDTQCKDLYLDYQTKSYCAAGLADLGLGNYKRSAKNLLKANIDYCDFPEIISLNNVAIYAGLCGLATFDRQELHKSLIFNSSYKNFLELEPQIKEIIMTFYQSKYDQCLKRLDEIKDNLLLDIYLAPHVNALYIMIRNRGMIQYFSTYLSVNMDKMAAAFNTNIHDLEEELMTLIMTDQILARIDSHNKVLYAKSIDQRISMYENAFSTAKMYQKVTSILILRSALYKIQAKVIASKKKHYIGDISP